MSMSDSQIINGIQILRLVTHFDVAAVTLFIWDYLLTLRMEIDLVWKSRWNFIKVLYLIQRYLPFVDTVALRLYQQLGTNLSTTTCRRANYASGTMMTVGIALSEIILTLRAWAVWNRNPRLAIILPVLFFACWGPDAAFLTIFLRSLEYANPPTPDFVGCWVVSANHYLILCWVVIMAWDAIILCFMAIPGMRAYRTRGSSALLKTIYGDGVIYYLYLFALSSINITVVKVLPPEYQHLLTSTTRCIHSMLTSRVLLHIRNHSSEPEWTDGLTELDRTHFHDELEFDPPKRQIAILQKRLSDFNSVKLASK